MNTWNLLYPCVGFLKKKYRRSGNLSCHHLETPEARTTKACSSEEIYQGQSSSLQRSLKKVTVSCQWLPIHLRKSDDYHPLRRSPRIPQEWGNNVRPDGLWQNTPETEKIFLHCSVLRMMIRLQTDVLHLFVPHTLYMERVRFFRMTFIPKKLCDSKRDHQL